MNSSVPASMQSLRLLDTREGAVLEAAAQTMLENRRPSLLRIIQQSQRLDSPIGDSWLGRVDRRTDPFEASQVARTFAMVAADNLRQVDRILRTSLPTFALYSLIRSAIEASSFGLWILDASDEQLAASRTLRIYRQNIASDRTMWGSLVAGSAPPHDHLHASAERRHRELRGIDHVQFEKAVRSSAVIDMVDRSRPNQTDQAAISALVAWRVCSSIVHANPVSMMHLLERHPDGNIGESATRTSRLSFVASFYVVACDRTEDLIDTFRVRSRPRRRTR